MNKIETKLKREDNFYFGKAVRIGEKRKKNGCHELKTSLFGSVVAIVF